MTGSNTTGRDTTGMTAGDLLTALGAGTVTAEQVVADLHERWDTDEAGPIPVHSVVRRDPTASAQAREIDRRRRDGEPLPPLAGLPLTVKDCFDVAGLTTGDGVPDHEYVAGTDAPAVAALRAAGVVVVGKTNVPPWLDDYQSGSAHLGITRHPQDRTRTPGGSSGGAAAVAAGHSWLDLGSDMTGSVRLPAAWCGVTSWRPSHGLVSKRGHLPWPPSRRLEPPASTVGITARTVADLLLPAEALLTGAPGGAGAAAPLGSAAEEIRLGVWMPGDWPVTGTEVRDALSAWCVRARDAGIELVVIRPPLAGPAEAAVYRRLMAAEIAHGAAVPDLAPPLLADLERQAEVVDAWSTEVFATVAAVVCPITPVVAPPLSAVPLDDRTVLVDGAELPASVIFDWGVITSLARGPVVTVPIGTGTGGLPIGAQLIGEHGRDRDLLALAVRLETSGLAAA
ncbi:hypothetical protein JL107_09550 [Nakamurella flavida]|uniref:Amidase domain-containing protein n=1 Tax=Nakamurella flavida TaxID=363630 RepID=A0A939C5Z3_9ACTN|nr:amidase family protein [Nakamurella flavida]MBM9476687.1 hypothetical protein [Nakamurella flavida]MDP9778875.1 amidase [Nakamurella flavida]